MSAPRVRTYSELVGQVLNGKYEVVDMVGSGAYGRVYLVEDTTGKCERRALKEVVLKGRNSKDDTDKTLKEADYLKKLADHVNIVKYYDNFIQDGVFYICMELCQGDLRRVIDSREKPINEDLVSFWFLQLASGMKYVHDKCILHRDIKPGNIFLANNVIKIGDFGISRVLLGSSLATTCIGTPLYMAPEVIKHEGYNSKSDIWAMGCVLFELVALQPAYASATWPELMERVSDGKPPDWPEGYSDDLKNVFLCTQEKKPSSRPSAGGLLKIMQVKLELYTQDLGALCPESSQNKSKVTSVKVSEDEATEKIQAARNPNTKKREAAYEVKKPSQHRVLKLRAYKMEIDNATTQDMKKVYRMFKDLTLGSSDTDTLTESSTDGAYTEQARKIKIEVYRLELEGSLGKNHFQKIFDWVMESRRSKKSESDIQAQITADIPDVNHREKMETLLFLQQQEK